MADVKDFLWGFYQEDIAYARHHETLRATVSAGIIGVITFDDKLSLADLPLSSFLTILGMFGTAFTAKHYERYCMHDSRLDEVRRKLDALLPDLKISDLYKTALSKHTKKYPRMCRLRLTYFWMALHLLIAFLGIVIGLLIVT